MSITLPEPHDGAAGPLLTPEDWARSRDRGRVARARVGGRRWLLFWLLAGPGILAMLGENDGPSMVSYTATGAAYGMGFFLPFIVVTFAMAIICQEMCMRVGAVTHRGYGQLVLERVRRLPMGSHNLTPHALLSWSSRLRPRISQVGSHPPDSSGASTGSRPPNWSRNSRATVLSSCLPCTMCLRFGLAATYTVSSQFRNASKV
jgi:hypothetical protein